MHKVLVCILSFTLAFLPCFLGAEETERVLYDITASQDVSGKFPDTVYIRTRTQSYCKYFEFVLSDGKIYAKRPGEKKWELFLKTGVPFTDILKDNAWFPTVKEVCEICCDADNIYAIDEQGIMYYCFIDSSAPVKTFFWQRLSGFPKNKYIKLNDLVTDMRGWSSGTRRRDILWYEDIYGIQHHWGTMGLETHYFLTGDGQHIRFTDSGLPTDFSRTIQNPENGTFIAENISVSGDTIFLIGSKGNMYTRLIDFDTMGCDPMWFQYTYDKLTKSSTGKDYISNYTPWALPSEDWAKQVKIPLKGKARLSKMISIAQTGRGNYARELRVAGTDEHGTIGYYHKMLFDTKWEFQEAPLVIQDNQYLDSTRPERGESYVADYQGLVYRNNSIIDGVVCRITNVGLDSEDRCTLSLENGNEVFKCKVYPVEKWTYIKRYNPGRDGTPRYYFITAELDENQLLSYSPEFRGLLTDIFKEKHHKLFAFSVEATEVYYQIQVEGYEPHLLIGGNAKHSYTFFMTQDGKNCTNPFLLKQGNSLAQFGIADPLSDNLVLLENHAYTRADAEEIKAKIEANKTFAGQLRAITEENRKSFNSVNMSRWGYRLADLITRITFLNKINFPKIKQMTSFGNDVMTTSFAVYNDIATYTDWTFPSVLELTELRETYYTKLLDAVNAPDSQTEGATLPPHFHNSFTGFYKDLQLGTHLTDSESGDTLEMFDVGTMFPWFILKKKDGTVLLVRLKNFTKTVLSGKTPYLFEASFRLINLPDKNLSKRVNNDFMKDINLYTGQFEWNGNTVRLYVKNAVFTKRLLFKGGNVPASEGDL